MVVLVSAIAVAALFVIDGRTQPDTYETHADVALDPITPRSLYDDEAAAVAPSEAMAGELEFARGRTVERAVDDEVTYAQSVRWTSLDETTLRVTTRAPAPELAVAAASSAGAIYGRVRMETARSEVDRAIAGLEAEVARLSAEVATADSAATATDDEALLTAQQELDRARQAREAIDTGTAFVTGVPDTPCCPEGGDPARSALVGLAVGLALGLAIAALVVAGDKLPRALTTTSTHGRPADQPLGAAPPSAPEGRPTRGRPWVRLSQQWAVRRTWAAPTGIALLVVGRSAVYAVLGARFLLDDYIHLYASRFLGALETSPHERLLNRPGAWLTQTALFNLSGQRPLLLFVLLSIVNVLAALALYFALARFFRPPVPFLVTALWVLTANHSTLTVWAAAGQGVVALALCFCGVNLLSRGRWIGAVTLFSASILSYEFAVAICFAASILVGTPLAPPLDHASATRTVRPWHRVIMVAVLGLVVWWMSRNPTHPLQASQVDWWDTLAGHVSSGLVATDAAPTLLLRALEMCVALGLVACVVAWLRGARSRADGPALAIVGTVVMGLGLVVAVAFPGGLYGLSNRIYGASSVGTAMVLAGIGLFLWHRARIVALVAAVILVAICAAGQFVALRAAHQAGEDGVALIRYLGATAEHPEDTSFLVEPRPEHNGFYGIDNLFDLYAYRLTWPDGAGDVQIASTQEEFSNPAPGQVTVTWAQVRGE